MTLGHPGCAVKPGNGSVPAAAVVDLVIAPIPAIVTSRTGERVTETNGGLPAVAANVVSLPETTHDAVPFIDAPS